MSSPILKFRTAASSARCLIMLGVSGSGSVRSLPLNFIWIMNSAQAGLCAPFDVAVSTSCVTGRNCAPTCLDCDSGTCWSVEAAE